MKKKFVKAIKAAASKKLGTRIISFLLLLIFTFSAIPPIVYAEAGEALKNIDFSSDSVSDGEAVSTDFDAPIYEVKALREEAVKHFRLSDGSYVAVQYDSPVHRLDGSGEWRDIDNTLVDEGSEFSTDDKRVKFTKKITGNGEIFTLHENNTKITFSLNGAKKKTEGKVKELASEETDGSELGKLTSLTNISSVIVYEDILDGIDVEYVIDSNDIKENIIVKERKASYVYSFTLKLNNLTATLSELGDILIADSNGEIAYTIPAPVIWDAAGAYADHGIGTYSLTDNGNGSYALILSVSNEWMNAEERIFPVTVDPTLCVKSSGITDLYVDASLGNRNNNYENERFLLVDVMTTAYISPYVANIPKNAYITEAHLHLHSTESSDATVKVHRVTSAWDKTLTYQDTIYSSKGTLYPNAMSYAKESELFEKTFILDITEAAKIWQNNSGLNFGVAITFGGGSEVNFISSEYYDYVSPEEPLLYISYTNVNGVEEYLPYSSHQIGDAVGSVNLATGNLALTIPTLTSSDSLMPYTPTLTYNTSLANGFCVHPNVEVPYTLSAAGLGFNLSMRQSVIKYKYDSSFMNEMFYYVWYDADGTAHYFSGEENATSYSDEDGLLLTLKDNGNNLKITNKDGSVMTFVSDPVSEYSETDTAAKGAWTLESITDSFGNKIRFDYAGQYPNTVYLKPKDTQEIEALEIMYGYSLSSMVVSGAVSVIYNPGTQMAVVFRYSDTYDGAISATSGRYLREIEYVYSNDILNATWLSYANGSLDAGLAGAHIRSKLTIDYTWQGYISKITESGENGLVNTSLNYTYSGSKVTKITETGSNSNLGQTLGFYYGNGYTETRTSGKDDVYDTSDDIITRYSFDNFGRCISTYSFVANEQTITGAVSGKYEEQENVKNNLKESVTVGGSSTNYIMNGDFSQAGDETYSEAKYWIFEGNANVPPAFSESRKAVFELAEESTESITQYVFVEQGEYTFSFKVGSYDGCKSTLTVTVESILPQSELSVTKTIPLNEHSVVTEKIVSMNFTVGSYVNTGDKIKITISATTGENVPPHASLSIDNVMLEDGCGVSNFDMVTMGNFEPVSIDFEGYYGDEPQDIWEASPGTTYRSGSTGYVFNASAMLYADPDKEVYLRQRIYDNEDYLETATGVINPKDTYIVSGYGRSFSAVNCGDATFGIKIVVGYYQGVGIEDVTVTYEYEFNPSCKDWQFVSGSFSTYVNNDAAYDRVKYIDVYCEYSYQCNDSYAMFDEISVVLSTDGSVQNYTYYENGMLESSSNFFYGEYYVYNENLDLIKKANNRGDLYVYAYNPDRTLSSETYYDYAESQQQYGIYWVESIEDIEYVEEQGYTTPIRKTAYTYSTYGQPTEIITYTEFSGTGTNIAAGAKQIVSKYTYQETAGSKIFGALLTEEDSLGNTVKYFYDTLDGKLLASINLDNGDGLAYVYDHLGRLETVLPASITASGYSKNYSAESSEYSYDGRGRLSVISTESTSYNFTYDSFGNSASVSADGNTLASYEYNANNGKLAAVNYGNGLRETYTYNELDLISEVCYTLNGIEAAKYKYKYTSDGRLHSFEDARKGKVTLYSYDYSGNIASISEYSTGDNYYDSDVRFLYNDNNQLTAATHKIACGSFDKSVSYDYFYNYDGTLQQETVSTQGISNNVNGSVSYTYDKFNRVSGTSYELGGFSYGVAYQFTASGNNTSAQVSKYTVTKGNLSSHSNYFYDSKGNITNIVYSTGEEIRYVYDDLGQLLREDNGLLGKTYVYTYDNAGNITGKKTYALTAAGASLGTPISTKNYGYSTSGWGDMLTSFGGTAITYDEIGNPLSYYNGSSYSFTWTGRQLTGAARAGNTYTFTYNDEGIRTSKTRNGVITTYYLNGSQIMAEETSGITKAYIYDANGLPIGMQVNSSEENSWLTYWFEKNLFGDIVAVYGNDGTKLISYTYDAWGNFTTTVHNDSASASIAEWNPFKYRGYYYDEDLGLYYLQTRYYDSTTGRFINADNMMSGVNGSLHGYNLYAYCFNNPVSLSDLSGNWPSWSNIFKGSSWLAIGITAVCVGVSVLTCGVATPAMATIAAVTTSAGALTAVNGAAEIGEAFTDYNFVRDTVFDGDQKVYDAYANTTAFVAEIGTAICGGWKVKNDPRIKAYNSIQDYNYTNTISDVEHMSRPYSNSVLTQKQVIKHGKMTKDSYGYVFSAKGSVNGKEKLWRLGVNNEQKLVWHWGHGF